MNISFGDVSVVGGGVLLMLLGLVPVLLALCVDIPTPWGEPLRLCDGGKHYPQRILVGGLGLVMFAMGCWLVWFRIKG